MKEGTGSKYTMARWSRQARGVGSDARVKRPGGGCNEPEEDANVIDKKEDGVRVE